MELELGLFHPETIQVDVFNHFFLRETWWLGRLGIPPPEVATKRHLPLVPPEFAYLLRTFSSVF